MIVYDLPDDSTDTQVSVPVLKLLPLSDDAGLIVVIGMDIDTELMINGAPVIGRGNKYAVVGCKPDLSDPDTRLIHESDFLDIETVIDAVPLAEADIGVLLGRTSSIERTETPLGSPVQHVIRDYWLQTVRADQSIGDKIPFLEEDWPVEDQTGTPVIRPDQTYTGRMADRYEPVALGGGRLGPLGQFLVVAIREDLHLDMNGVRVPDTRVFALTALFVEASTMRVAREVVFRRVITGGAVWTPVIRCSSVSYSGPLWHVGVLQDPNVPETVSQLAVHSVTTEGGLSPVMPNAVFWAAIATDNLPAILDFSLAAERLDMGRSATWGRVETEAMALVTHRGATPGTFATTTFRYTDFDEEVFPPRSLPQITTFNGPTQGSAKIILDATRGSRYHVVDQHLYDGDTRRTLRLRKLGARGATFQQRGDSVPPGSLRSEIGLCFDPVRQTLYRATQTRRPPFVSNATSIDIAAERAHGYGRTLIEHGRDCPAIAPRFSRVFSSLPEPLIVPAIGNRYFEVSLDGAPAGVTVTLLITAQYPADYPGCTVRLDQRAPGATLFTALTDAGGNATVSVPLDPLGLPNLLRTDTPEFVRAGEILHYPLVLFGQWFWQERGPDEDTDTGIGLGPIYALQWRGSKVMTILMGV